MAHATLRDSNPYPVPNRKSHRINSEDYTARRRAREEEEKTEKARVPRRSINERLRTGSTGTGRQRDASNRYSYSAERSISFDAPEVAKAAREYRLNRRSQILENSETSTERHKSEIQSGPSSTEASPGSHIESVTPAAPLAEGAIFNPDTSTLTLKTSRRKDQLSLELASIALGRQIQVETIPAPVSSGRAQKLNQASDEVQGKRPLSRSKSEDVQLISSRVVEAPTNDLSPSSPEPPPRASKKVRAPHPPVSGPHPLVSPRKSLGATPTEVISVQANNPSVAEGSDRITTQEIHPHESESGETCSQRNDTSDDKRAVQTSSAVPQRPPRLKKRSPQVSVELVSPEPTPVENGHCLFEKLSQTESSLLESRRDVEQSLTTNSVDSVQSLTLSKSSALDTKDNIGECSRINKFTIVTDTTKQVEAVTETPYLISQDTPSTISSESQQTSELYSPKESPPSPELGHSKSLDIIVEPDDDDAMMKTSKAPDDVSTNQPPGDIDDAPPPLPSSPPPLPSSAPPLVNSSTYVQKDDPFSCSDTVEEETVVTVEYTVPISLTPEQRRGIAGLNSGVSESRQGQNLLDFDPLFTSSATSSEIKMNGITMHTPTASANMNRSSAQLIDFNDNEVAVRNDVKSTSSHLFDYVITENVSDNKGKKPETIKPGGSGQSTSGYSSTTSKSASVTSYDITSPVPASKIDTLSTAWQEDIIKPSTSSPARHSSRPNTLTNSDHTSHFNGGVAPTSSKTSPGERNVFSDTGPTHRGKGSQNGMAISPTGEGAMSPRGERAMSPRGKELVDKAKHFADMVQPKVVVRREKEANIEGDFSQDTLQSLELQRRAIISQSTVKRRVNSALSPSEDLESKMFQGEWVCCVLSMLTFSGGVTSSV
ncbi:hypothetical protein Btru_059316 [Bulinus truncatus]|nr:hypothetical protein Btru_059316 [Bulinus truncatus]